MNISELSIRRPVLATVLTIIILLFGFIGYNYLGVREYPSVDNPIISVRCYRKSDNRTIGTEYQWYPRYPFFIQCQPARTKSYYRRV